MPRDSSGNYMLPDGNPVVTGTLIESEWANTTMDDLASGTTNSLDRQGRGGMEAQLKLINGDATTPAMSFISNTNVGLYYDGTDVKYSNGAIDDAIIGEAPDDLATYGRSAKGWKAVDIGGYTPLPIGSIVQFSADPSVLPAGWLVCDHSAVSRTTYADLADLYENTPPPAGPWPHGDGDGTTTFNLPDFRGRVPIGPGSGTPVLTPRIMGNKYGAEETVLGIDQIPAHSHEYKGVNAQGTAAGVISTFGSVDGQTEETGGGQGHDNLQPSMGIYFIVKALEDTVGGVPNINGHVIQDENTTFTQRTNLKFEGAGVTVTDDDTGDPNTSASIITIPDAGGPGGTGTINKVGAEGTTIATDRSEVNFIEGTNVTLLVQDNAGSDRADVTISAEPGAPAPVVMKLGTGFAIGGPITAGMSVAGQFVPVAVGQSTQAVSATFVLGAGTATVQMFINNVQVGPDALVTTTPDSIVVSPAITVLDNQFMTLVVTVADTSAELLSFTCDLEHTV